MPEEFNLQKLRQESPEFFSEFPVEFLDFVFSEEFFNRIADICVENGVKDEDRIEQIASRIALVLLEQVPKENFVKMLELGVKLEHKTAQKIYLEVKRLIFSQAPGVYPKKDVSKRPYSTIYEVLFGDKETEK